MQTPPFSEFLKNIYCGSNCKENNFIVMLIIIALYYYTIEFVFLVHNTK
jgi:phenylalanine-4-hydroxylase